MGRPKKVVALGPGPMSLTRILDVARSLASMTSSDAAAAVAFANDLRTAREAGAASAAPPAQAEMFAQADAKIEVVDAAVEPAAEPEAEAQAESTAETAPEPRRRSKK